MNKEKLAEQPKFSKFPIIIGFIFLAIIVSAIVSENAEKPTKIVVEKPTKTVVEKPTKTVVEKPTKIVVEKPSEKPSKHSVTKTFRIDPELIKPYTEYELRRKVRDKSTDESVVYRARHRHTSDLYSRVAGQNWTECRLRMKPVMGKDRFWAVMHLADFDAHNGYNEQRW